MSVWPSLLLIFLSFNLFAQSGSLISEDFTNYDGTSGTTPAGWFFNSHGNYTSSTYSGASGPNAYRFGIDQAEIISPAFQNADSVRFWLKGAGTDSLSYLVLLESPDSISWIVIDTIRPVSLSATVFHYPVSSSSIHLKFIYRKSVGNCSLDDVEIFSTPDNPGGRIITYFTKPTDTTVGFSPHAVHLNQSLDDTLIAYIDRSLISLDIAMYNFVQNGNLSSIVSAVNNAFNRGVAVRWIYNGTSSNAGVLMLNPSIPVLMSPTTSSYGIMHNKFMIIDAASPDPSKAFVWTGSLNWEDAQVNTDYNNVVIIQDPHFAKACTREFNQMWGGSGTLPDITLARFGPTKFENNIHLFKIGGRSVELYFSPAQKTESHLRRVISTANDDLYFGIYAFTRDTIASVIKSGILGGVYTAGIIDPFSVPYTADDTLIPVMGSLLKIFSLSGLYHNKYIIVDFSDTVSDPCVLTGSHNWTNAADTKNDENTVIIHDPFIVSQFYEAFYSDYAALGGQLNLNEIPTPHFNVFPNPAANELFISASLGSEMNLTLFDMQGRRIIDNRRFKNRERIDVSYLSSGLYMLVISMDGFVTTTRLVISH